MQYYARLRESIEAGQIDLDKTEIYSLLYSETVSPDHARKALRVLDMTLDADTYCISEDPETSATYPNKTSIEINKDGSQSSSRLIEMSEENSKDTSFLLKAHGYDASQWEITSAKSSIWNTSNKQNGVRELYSSKISVRPRDGLSYDEILGHFEKFSKTYIPPTIVPKQYEYGAECLVPCFFDVHFSKLAAYEECGEKYDYKIAKQRVLDSVQTYIARLGNRKFEKIIFAVGNDYFNSEGTGDTVNNTRQDNDTRYNKMFNKGVETLIETIDLLSTVAPVDVLLIQGNHAFYAEFYATCVLKAWYRNSEFVTIDNTASMRKYRRFGENLLGFTHGSEEKDRIYGLMQVEAAEEWGQCKGAKEWLIGHLHVEGVTEKNGVVVRRIPSLTGLDAWHVKSGFTTAKKRTMAFIYDKEMGLIETHYVNI